VEKRKRRITSAVFRPTIAELRFVILCDAECAVNAMDDLVVRERRLEPQSMPE
jgi:hypothetical protein